MGKRVMRRSPFYLADTSLMLFGDLCWTYISGHNQRVFNMRKCPKMQKLKYRGNIENSLITSTNSELFSFALLILWTIIAFCTMKFTKKFFVTLTLSNHFIHRVAKQQTPILSIIFLCFFSTWTSSSFRNNSSQKHTHRCNDFLVGRTSRKNLCTFWEHNAADALHMDLIQETPILPR